MIKLYSFFNSCFNLEHLELIFASLMLCVLLIFFQINAIGNVTMFHTYCIVSCSLRFFYHHQ